MFFMQLCSLSLLSATKHILPVVMQCRESFAADWMCPHMKTATPPQLLLPPSLSSTFVPATSVLWLLPLQSWGNAAERSWTEGWELGEDQDLKVASITHKCDLEGCTSGPHCSSHWTNRSSSPPFKTTLLYSFFLSGAVLTCAMFQGISERVGIDAKQMLIKDVRNETLFVATAQHLNWFHFHHRCTLTDQGSNAHFNMHPNWS